MKTTSLFLLAAVLLLGSCVTGPKIETLYVGEGVLQYFVFPTTLKNSDSKISIDITFRKIKGKEGFATVNFSHFYNDLKEPDLKTAGFVSGEKYFPLSGIKILYQEKRNNLIRYTSQIKESEFMELLKIGDPSFFIENDKGKSFFPANSDLKDKFKELSIELL